VSEPWEFSMDTEAKTLLGFVAGFAMICFIAWRVDMSSRSTDASRASVQIACLQAGHPALECKELR
jgi:hypothetical protein